MHFKYTTDRLELSETRSSIIMNDNAAVDHFPRAKWGNDLEQKQDSFILSLVYTSKFYLTNFICQRYFACVDDKFVTNLL